MVNCPGDGDRGFPEDLARALRGTPPEARNLSRLQEIAKLLERFPRGGSGTAFWPWPTFGSTRW